MQKELAKGDFSQNVPVNCSPDFPQNIIHPTPERLAAGFHSYDPYVVYMSVLAFITSAIYVVSFFVSWLSLMSFHTQLPPQIAMKSKKSANNGLGGEPMRRSMVPLPLPPDHNNFPVSLSFGIAPPTATAVVGVHHCSLVIVPLLQTVTVIFLVLLLPPKKMPIPDCEICLRRATYNNNGSPALITRTGSCCCWPGGEDDPRQSTPFLCQPLGSISGAICTLYDARSKSQRLSSHSMPLQVFPIRIRMIVQPHC